MGVLGDMIRFTKETINDSLEECGFEGMKDEIRDVIKALKEKV